MQSLEPEVRMAVNLIFDELQGNRPSGPETRRPPGGQPEPSRPSDQSMEEVPHFSKADDILLRGLGVRWEPEADEANG
jgi:hypothetical protein